LFFQPKIISRVDESIWFRSGKWLQGRVSSYIRRRYLTLFFCYQTWQFELIRKKIRQRERPLVMTIVSSRLWRGEYSISSPTWASYDCLSFLIGSQGLITGWAKSISPTSFLSNGQYGGRLGNCFIM